MLNYDTANTIQFISGLSIDEKPKDDIRIGSVFTEIDTGKRYRFDGIAWVENNSEVF